jgi:integrase
MTDPKPGPTLADAITAYIDDRRARGEIGAETARQFAWRLNSLIKACPPGLPIAGLGRDHIAAWQRQVGWQKPASRRAYLSTVKVFTAWAADNELLEADPAAKAGRVREPRYVPRALSAAQLARLSLVLPDERARLMVALMARLGLRCVEVARLAVGDYDPAAATLLVRGKADNERLLPVPADIAALLDAWTPRPAHPFDRRLFGLDRYAVSSYVTAWMTAAGLKTAAYDGISAHALRHTAASNLLDACDNVRTVQQFLGHANLATTDRYLRKANLAQLRAALAAPVTPESLLGRG